MKGYSFEDSKTREGLRKVKTLSNIIGRWHWLSLKPRILCDSGHNEAGIREILVQLKQLKYNRLHFIFGMVKDKDLSYLLKSLPKDATYYVAKADIPRGLDANVLLELMETFNLKGQAYPSVVTALEAAKNTYQEGDLIFVGGSIFVVAEVI